MRQPCRDDEQPFGQVPRAAQRVGTLADILYDVDDVTEVNDICRR
jgi:hypothetical protein